MIIDFHFHVHDDAEGTWSDLTAAEAKRIGIDCVVMYECITHSRDSVELMQERNDVCFESYNRYPELFIPFVYTHPNLGDVAIDELKKGFDMGAQGIKLEVACQITDKCVEPVIEMAIERDVPIVQHSWHKITGNLPHETDPVHCAEIGRRYPELKLVMAHIGGDNRWGMRAIRDVPGVYTDCSGSICDYGSIEETVRHLGADRLLWGSDGRGADWLYTLGKVKGSDLSEEDKAKVLGLNAARLLGLDTDDTGNESND
ncbi:MAG: amidohydrolase family protein [Armatimonadota bacterium]